MESPYRPPQELESNDYSALPHEAGEFQLMSDEQQMLGKLAKYLGDIGGLLILLAVLSILGFAFSVFAGATVLGVGGAGAFDISMLIALLQQLVTIVCLFGIGLVMRSAAKAFRQTSVTVEYPMAEIMQSLSRVVTLYGWQMGYVMIGIAATVISFAVSALL